MMRWWWIPILLLTSLAWAHQQKEAVTTVLFNERTGNIEVMHRFLLHDAEHAMRERGLEDADLLGSEAARRAFADYVRERFGIADGNRQPLPLKPVGHEIERKFLWIYDETPIPPELEVLIIRNDALADVWPEQVNLVNVERGGETRSITFSGAQGAVQLVLGPARPGAL